MLSENYRTCADAKQRGTTTTSSIGSLTITNSLSIGCPETQAKAAFPDHQL
jgi:hypothetical protein